ncbi:hypothetical protein EJ04DRAFT_153263 [Polyplosphaeria fusca]|uniref:DUF7707 domain-containing protein n=1 Tax=Polyplosphaeria fusca TaxID=682080 RepID=A0A9P4R463_9PLEO|nr:hypothetical protein EJ04DRAFT_153263 [Polyplosphaeria fusca]
MLSIIALTLLSMAGLPAAQDTPQQNYPYTIEPDSVDSSLRQTWCDNQKAACPLICLQQPGVETMSTVSNDCDPDSLVYSCVCSNNVSPNITQYTQTLPYYICTEWGNQCVAQCSNSDASCANDCRADHPCGAQDPPKGNASLSTMSSMTATATPSSSDDSNSIPISGFAGATPTGSSNDKPGAASSMLNLGQSYGLAVVFAGVFAGFAIVL